jgi:hypothetical protein
MNSMDVDQISCMLYALVLADVISMEQAERAHSEVYGIAIPGSLSIHAAQNLRSAALAHAERKISK